MWKLRSGSPTEVTRDFSSRYVEMVMVPISPFSENRMIWNLPKRDELLLRVVLALPNASRTGFVLFMISVISSVVVDAEAEPERKAK